MSKVIAVFDFDGTLVNTPVLYHAAHLDILQALTRWRLPPPRPAYEEYLRATAALEGFDHRSWYREHGIEIVDQLPKNEGSGWKVRFNDGTETSVRIQIAYPSCEEGITKVSESDFERLFDAFFAHHYLTEIKMMPGARYMIEVLLKRGIPLVIISKASLEHMRQILDHLELPQEIFDYIISSNDKTKALRGRPGFPWIAGADNFYFYIGDMPADIVFARDAGMTSIAFMSDINRCIEDLIDAQHPDYKINDWRKLLTL